MKAAHVALFGTAYRKYGYLPGFGRCGIPRLSAGHSPLATGLDVYDHLHPVHSDTVNFLRAKLSTAEAFRTALGRTLDRHN